MINTGAPLVPKGLTIHDRAVYLTWSRIAKYTVGIETKRTCQVITARTQRFEYAFIVAPQANINANGTSRSTMLRSDETYKTTTNTVQYSFRMSFLGMQGTAGYITRLRILPNGVES